MNQRRGADILLILTVCAAGSISLVRQREQPSNPKITLAETATVISDGDVWRVQNADFRSGSQFYNFPVFQERDYRAFVHFSRSVDTYRWGLKDYLCGIFIDPGADPQITAAHMCDLVLHNALVRLRMAGKDSELTGIFWNAFLLDEEGRNPVDHLKAAAISQAVDKLCPTHPKNWSHPKPWQWILWRKPARVQARQLLWLSELAVLSSKKDPRL